VAALAAARAASPRFGRLQIVSDGLAALRGCLSPTLIPGREAVPARFRGLVLPRSGPSDGAGADCTAELDALANAVLDRFGGDIARLHAWLTIASPADYAMRYRF
jgi:hypothetical protein